MAKWIFADIIEYKKQWYKEAKTKYGGDLFGEAKKNYHDKLRNNVPAETFMKYKIWKRDIYVSVEQVTFETQEIYDIPSKDIYKFLEENINENQFLVS